MDVESLSRELDSIFDQDQLYRSEMAFFNLKTEKDSLRLKEIVAAQSKIDSTNLLRIQQIIEEIGDYPGKSLVGESASKVAFFVLQHSNPKTQSEYLDLILKAAQNLELNKSYAAMYHDRILLSQEKPQIYGTQIKEEWIIDSTTGERTKRSYLWPIADTTHIDSLRMWNGLIPLNTYLNQMGVNRWE